MKKKNLDKIMSNYWRIYKKKVSVIPGFKKHLYSIQQSISLLSDKYGTLLVEHEQTKEKLLKLEKTVTNVSNKCVYLEKCNLACKQKLQEYEQSMRNNNLEIAGIEYLPGENLKTVVTNIAAKIGANCDGIDWVKRRRPPKEGSKPPPIVVGFKSSGAGSRDWWLANRRKIEFTSDVVTGGVMKTKIYINKDLISTTRLLLWNVKKELSGIYKYIWVSNGRILLKKQRAIKYNG
jgi:hypothetical protein